jgi:hypothetical protein
MEGNPNGALVVPMVAVIIRVPQRQLSLIFRQHGSTLPQCGLSVGFSPWLLTQPPSLVRCSNLNLKTTYTPEYQAQISCLLDLLLPAWIGPKKLYGQCGPNGSPFPPFASLLSLSTTGICLVLKRPASPDTFQEHFARLREVSYNRTNGTGVPFPTLGGSSASLYDDKDDFVALCVVETSSRLTSRGVRPSRLEDAGCQLVMIC